MNIPFKPWDLRVDSLPPTINTSAFEPEQPRKTHMPEGWVPWNKGLTYNLKSKNNPDQKCVADYVPGTSKKNRLKNYPERPKLIKKRRWIHADMLKHSLKIAMREETQYIRLEIEKMNDRIYDIKALMNQLLEEIKKTKE